MATNYQKLHKHVVSNKKITVIQFHQMITSRAHSFLWAMQFQAKQHNLSTAVGCKTVVCMCVWILQSH